MYAFTRMLFFPFSFLEFFLPLPFHSYSDLSSSPSLASFLPSIHPSSRFCYLPSVHASLPSIINSHSTYVQRLNKRCSRYMTYICTKLLRIPHLCVRLYACVRANVCACVHIIHP